MRVCRWIAFPGESRFLEQNVYRANGRIFRRDCIRALNVARGAATRIFARTSVGQSKSVLCCQLSRVKLHGEMLRQV